MDEKDAMIPYLASLLEVSIEEDSVSAVSFCENGGKNYVVVRFQITTTASMNITILWDITPYIFVEADRRFSLMAGGGGSKHI
jgi:hypothetical protein